MLNKRFLTTGAFAIATAMSIPAHAVDPVGGAALGAGVGAVAGHAVSGRDGALVGGALGAVAGYNIAKHHRSTHRQTAYRSYHRPARTRYAPQPAYSTRPVYYAPRAVHHGHRHVHTYRDRHGRLVRVVSWR